MPWQNLRLSKTAKIMCVSLGGIYAVFLAAGLAVIYLLYPFEAPFAYAVGLLAGSLLSIVKVVMMERSLNRAADMAEYNHARSYGTFQVFVRNVLTLGLLALAFLFRDLFGLFGTIIGVLSIQLSALVTGFLLRKNETQV